MRASVVLFFCVIVGFVVGSFLNVVISRVPQGLSVVHPRSACPKCQTAIAGYDNIPILSWIILGGRCRSCRQHISVRYPAVELLTAALFSAAALRFGPSWTLPAMLVFLAGLVALALIDFDHLLLPKRIVYLTAALVGALLIVAAGETGDFGRLGRAVLCAAVGFSVFLVINLVSPRSLGFGDVRLAPLLGLCLGWMGVGYAVLGFALANLIGAVIGLSLVAARKADRNTAVPYGVFLASGSVVSMLLGAPILHWYSSALR